MTRAILSLRTKAGAPMPDPVPAIEEGRAAGGACANIRSGRGGQSQTGCVVHEIPQAAFEMGAAEKEVSLSAMPGAIPAACRT
jgi:chemotaxis response regulator CheB